MMSFMMLSVIAGAVIAVIAYFVISGGKNG
jgi:hypothetical protein